MDMKASSSSTLEQVKGYRSTFDKLLVLFALHFKYVMNIVCIPFTNHKLQNLHQQQKSGKMEADELFAFRILCFIPAIIYLTAGLTVSFWKVFKTRFSLQVLITEIAF